MTMAHLELRSPDKNVAHPPCNDAVKYGDARSGAHIKLKALGRRKVGSEDNIVRVDFGLASRATQAA